MSLNYNLTKIKNHEKLCWVRDNSVPESEWTDKKGWKMNPVTDVLIWITIAVDMGDITEDNVHEFYWRLRFREKYLNYKVLISTRKDGKPGRSFNPTLNQIRQHIGLTTNVRTLTRYKFLNNMLRIMKEQLNETLRHEQKLKKPTVASFDFHAFQGKAIDRLNRNKSQSIKVTTHELPAS